MKLKKIASLMLAGVMAVSMLAGCQNANVDPEQPTNPIQPGTNGVSAAVEARLGTPAPEYVDFADDADLDNALQYAVEYAGVGDILPDYMHANSLVLVNPVLSDVLKEEVGDDGTAGVPNIGLTYILQQAENQNSYSIPDEVAVEMYAISNVIGENAVNQMVADYMDSIVASYEYSTRGADGWYADGGNYNYEYTVSVSTYTKTIDGAAHGTIGGNAFGFAGHGDAASNAAVTFVAIQVVRTATHQ